MGESVAEATLTSWLKEQYSVKGLAWMKCLDGNLLEGGISKFFDSNLQKNIIKSCKILKGDIIFIIGDKSKTALKTSANAVYDTTGYAYGDMYKNRNKLRERYATTQTNPPNCS